METEQTDVFKEEKIEEGGNLEIKEEKETDGEDDADPSDLFSEEPDNEIKAERGDDFAVTETIFIKEENRDPLESDEKNDSENRFEHGIREKSCSHAQSFREHRLTHEKGQAKKANLWTRKRQQRSDERRRFDCAVCGKSYAHRESLWLHKSHGCAAGTKERFECETCEKSYSRLSSLRKHERTRHGSPSESRVSATKRERSASFEEEPTAVTSEVKAEAKLE